MIKPYILKQLCATVLTVAMAVLCFSSCSYRTSSDALLLADSLNSRAFQMRYSSLDSMEYIARKTLEQVHNNPQGRSEAMNMLAYAALHKMRWTLADSLYTQVTLHSVSDLEKMVAQVGLMEVSRLQGSNKRFYLARTQAQKHMDRIAEERSSFITQHEQERIEYAFNAFYLSEVSYYEQQGLPVPLETSLRAVSWLQHPLPTYSDIQSGTSYHLQQLYAFVVQSTINLKQAGGADFYQEQMDALLQVWEIATQEHLPYLQGLSLLGMAEARMVIPMPNDSLYPAGASRRAFYRFKQVHSPYQQAEACLMQGRIANSRRRYQAALGHLKDGIFLLGGDRVRYPLMAALQEQLSVAFAGLGSIDSAVEHRSAYLNVLEANREDKAIIARRDELEVMAKHTNVLLFVLIFAILLLSVLLFLLNRYSRQRARKTEKMRSLLLQLCRKIIALTPPEDENLSEELWKEEMSKDLSDMRAELDTLIDSSNQTRIEQLIDGFWHWSYRNGQSLSALVEQRELLDKQHYVVEQQLAQRKRQHTIKKSSLAIVNGLSSGIDRMAHVLSQMTKESNVSFVAQSEQFRYLDELLKDILLQNQQLVNSIQMKQGQVALQISRFSLQNLFDIQEQRSKSFQLKEQTLVVLPTSYQVKADEALTLFMINTLLENARKFTPAGGTITLSATAEDNFVEISIADTGYGLSSEDISHLLNDKVVDSQQVGDTNESHIKENKGSGFGLMNCRGIIEKYRKTSPLFDVCRLHIESRLHKGSRFSFRLPRVLALVGVFLLCQLPGLVQDAHAQALIHKEQSVYVLADSCHAANQRHMYSKAIRYAAQAMNKFNQQIKKDSSFVDFPTLSPYAYQNPAEFYWWDRGVQVDYQLILYLRNELAIAYLSQNKIDQYTFNNDCYTQLYKLVSSDETLSAYCDRLKTSTTNRTVGLALCLLVVLSMILGYYRYYLLPRWRTRRHFDLLLDIHSQLADSVQLDDQVSEEQLDYLPHDMLQHVQGSCAHLFDLRSLRYISQKEYLQLYEKQSKEDKTSQNQAILCKPLAFDQGALLLTLAYPSLEAEQQQLLDILADYLGQLLNQIVSLRKMRMLEIVLAQDDMERTQWESRTLHIQNMVLDNGLSTIKHETLYYPNRIKQLIDKCREHELIQSSDDYLVAAAELGQHYRSVHQLLVRGANRVLHQTTFKREVIPVARLVSEANKIMKRLQKKGVKSSIIWQIDVDENTCFRTDKVLHTQLHEVILQVMTTVFGHPNQLKAIVRQEGHFICLEWQDEGTSLHLPSPYTIDHLFDTQLGINELLIAKQIIRDVDEFAGLRGCRISASGLSGKNGYRIFWTMPIHTPLKKQ